MVTFVTSNKNKAKEIREILGDTVKIRKLDLPEIQSMDLDKVITEKAKAAYSIIRKPVVVEDISFEIHTLKGLPGPFIKFFLETLGTEGTVKLVGKQKTNTTVTAAVAYFDGSKLKILKGSIEGTLSKKDKGNSGFAFDRIFIPKGQNKTYAEMLPEEKNKISHRSKALKKLKNYLENYLRKTTSL